MKSCIVCDSMIFRPMYKNLLLRCENCGFVTTDINVSESELREIYSDKYFNGTEYVNYVGDKSVHRINFKNRLKRINAVTDKSKMENILEIGCAHGFFGELVTENNQEINYLGFDISQEAVKYAQKEFGLNVTAEDFLRSEIKTKPTDVFMWDVIEHLPNPERYFEKISSIITQNGRLYITTGDIEKFIPKMRKRKWRMIHPPTHLHYFSKRTLTDLLREKGFEVIYCSYPSVSRSIRLIFFSLFQLNKRQSSFSRFMFKMIPSRWYISINMRDILFLIAVKTRE